MVGEEIREVIEKPQSMLGAKVKQVLVNVIKKETEKALKEGDYVYVMELQNARKLIERGAWKVRKANPYVVHMEKCLVGKGGTLKATQEAMRECAEKWRKLSDKEKKRLKVEAGELMLYDYL